MVQRKMWAMEMAVVVLGLLAMVQQSMQLSLKNPLPSLPLDIRSDDVKAFGLITTSFNAEKALNESGFFAPTSHVKLFGRTFIKGEIHGFPVVYVRTAGSPSVHVGITVQILATNFNLEGIIHFGSCGATNQSLSIGTVIVPFLIGVTSDWTWLSKESTEKGPLVFGDYNYPVKGQNLLGSVKINDIEIYYNGRLLQAGNFWLYRRQGWYNMASGVKIRNGEVVLGLNGSSSDIYVNNPAYGKFLFDTFRVSTVDTSSAAAVLAANSNTLRHISFQGISNYAGAGDPTSVSIKLASDNAVEAVINFIREFPPPNANEAVDL